MLVKGQVVDLNDVKISDHAKETIERGQQSLERLRAGQTWEAFKEVGFAIDTGRTAIMKYLRINSPNDGGKRYALLMSDFLERYGFKKGLDNPALSRLHKCIDHMVEIEAWRETLSDKERMEWNHP